MATTLTSGHIGVTPVRFEVDIELPALQEALQQHRYQGEVEAPGWGSLEDEESRLGRRLARRPAGGSPVYLADPRIGPERVEARFYFDRYDAALDRQSDSGIEANYLYISDALDVVFTRGAGEIQLLVSTTNRTNITKYLRPALNKLAQSLGADGPVVTVGRPEGKIDNDLFLWLLGRYNGQRDLCEGVVLEDIRGLAVNDPDGRPTRMLRECLISRRAIQATVTELGAVFGPIKFKVSDDVSELIVAMELHVDASFTVQRMESDYYDTVEVDADQFGRVVIDDVAFSLLPRLEAAHRSDEAWHKGGRVDFLKSVKALLV